MKCDLCTEDNGEGIHYHAFIDGKHHWVCEACKSYDFFFSHLW